MSIHFFTEGINFKLPKKRILRTWLTSVVSAHNQSIDSVNIILCSDNYLLEINKNYLDHDYYTDVITFPYHKTGEAIQGDIFISLERIRENAKDRNLSPSQELHRVMVHGLLHLIGFDDKTEPEKARMTKLEDNHLKELDIIVSRGTIS